MLVSLSAFRKLPYQLRNKIGNQTGAKQLHRRTRAAGFQIRHAHGCSRNASTATDARYGWVLCAAPRWNSHFFQLG